METPEFYQGDGYYNNVQFAPEKLTSITKSGGGDNFIVEDLLDFTNDDDVVVDGKFEPLTGISTDSSGVTAVDSCNSSFISGNMVCRGFAEAQFSNDLCVQYDDLAELEWLSNIGEESFSSEDLQKLQLISGMTSRADGSSETREFNPDPNSIFHSEVSVPGKARSKRSRVAPCNWASHLLTLSSTTTTEVGPTLFEQEISGGKKTVKSKKRDGGYNHVDGSENTVEWRKCLHCATDKTPQWRTGPMGPKTLCNACGVRYKSGRLVPEYRPAASPTFVMTKHSNSHRKVTEIRRQKEALRTHQQPPFGQLLHQDHVNFQELEGDDYLIHQHVGPNFGHLI